MPCALLTEATDSQISPAICETLQDRETGKALKECTSWFHTYEQECRAETWPCTGPLCFATKGCAASGRPPRRYKPGSSSFHRVRSPSYFRLACSNRVTSSASSTAAKD